MRKLFQSMVASTVVLSSMPASAELTHLECFISTISTRLANPLVMKVNYSFDEEKSNELKSSNGNIFNAEFTANAITWGMNVQNKKYYVISAARIDRQSGSFNSRGKNGTYGKPDTHEEWTTKGTCKKVVPTKF